MGAVAASAAAAAAVSTMARVAATAAAVSTMARVAATAASSSAVTAPLVIGIVLFVGMKGIMSYAAAGVADDVI